MLSAGIERDTCITISSPNAGKHWPNKISYSSVFYTVFTLCFSEEPKSHEQIRLEQSLYPKTVSHYIYPDEDYLHSGTSFQRVNGPKRNYFIIHPDFVSENTGRRLLEKKKVDKRYFGESKVAYWYMFCDLNCLGCWIVLRQKGKFQNGCYKKTKHAKFSAKRTFLIPHVCLSGGEKCSFSGKFGVLCLLVTPVVSFALLPYYRRITKNRA